MSRIIKINKTMFQCILVVLISITLSQCGTNTTDPATLIEVQEFEDLLNKHRQSVGCVELIWSDKLAIVAQKHSSDMNKNGFFSHINLQGQSPFDRMKEENLTFTAAAENIARASLNPETVLSNWLNSPGHKGNIENCSYTHHGVGMEQGYWTHMFWLP